jgi:Holliday junction resolvase RusA-like endonuclease
VSELVITVYGTPAPQGSKRHVGNGVMVESSKAVKPWREAVKHAALATESSMIRQPVGVEVVFYLKRPQGHYRTGRNAHLLRDTAPAHPKVKPDLDKLARSTLDALSDAGIWDDDCQVVNLQVFKRYCRTGQAPGAQIVIHEIWESKI